MLSTKNYVIIDFETANNNPESICQIGMIKVINNKVVDTYKALVKPDPYYFSSSNIQIHGITKDDVRDALTFSEIYPSMEEFIDNNLLIAHHAPFDMNCLHKALKDDCFTYNYKFVCSCRIAKEFINTPNHKLTYLSQYVTNYQYQAHDALEDCFATFELLNHMFNNYDVNTKLNQKYQIGSINKEQGYKGFVLKK